MKVGPQNKDFSRFPDDKKLFLKEKNKNNPLMISESRKKHQYKHTRSLLHKTFTREILW